MPKPLSSNPSILSKIKSVDNKVWIIVGISVAAGIIILAESQRRRRRRSSKLRTISHDDFEAAFTERFTLYPFPQPPPPARLPLSSLHFSIKDIFDVKGYVTGFGNPDWKKTHDAAEKTAFVVTTLLKNGATCAGKTLMDELAFGILGENHHYGTLINPKMPSNIPGGSSSGSAVTVAAELVDFSIGTDTLGCVRAPAALCGILGFRSSHGSISMIGVLPNSQSLDTVGWFARDPSVLQRVGCALLQNQVDTRGSRNFIYAEDLFQLSKVPKHKTLDVVDKVIEKLSGYQSCKKMTLGQYIASNVPSLKGFLENPSNLQGLSILKALSSAMLSLQRYEFKTNHSDWVKSVKPRLGADVSEHVLAAMNSTHENIKSLYKVRTEMRSALQNILKDYWILVIPTILDYSLKVGSKKSLRTEFLDRAYALLSITSMSGCCQVSIPIGMHDGAPISVSLIAAHGADKFLLNTVLDMYSSLQEQACLASNLISSPDSNGSLDACELLKEKGNAAYKGRQWNKAVNYYSEAIKLNGTNGIYYCNRAAAYLELGCFQEAESDCERAISLDKKNVKAYLRRGTAREALLYYKEALQGLRFHKKQFSFAHEYTVGCYTIIANFKHALVLEPQNKAACDAEKRLRKLIT